MKITVRCENQNVSKTPVDLTFEVSDEDCNAMVFIDYQNRLEATDDKSSVGYRSVQEIMDEEFNKPLYNDWQTEHRHRGEITLPTCKNGEETGGIDSIDTVPDYSEEENRNRASQYEALCQKIRTALKPEYANVVIAVYLDDKTPGEYAKEIGIKRDAVYKRLQRAKKKIERNF